LQVVQFEAAIRELLDHDDSPRGRHASGCRRRLLRISLCGSGRPPRERSRRVAADRGGWMGKKV
jgi:hypothetical protein